MLLRGRRGFESRLALPIITSRFLIYKSLGVFYCHDTCVLLSLFIEFSASDIILDFSAIDMLS